VKIIGWILCFILFFPSCGTTEETVDDREFSFDISLFDPQHDEDGERLWSQTKLVAVMGLGVAGVLAVMPESVTGWSDDSSIDELPQRWWDNVRSGPVWDDDDWQLNFIGHPYFGGVYYQVARKSGFSQWDSFVYSALMSAFYWEYGVEAFAEVPSIQDLIVTPIGGWLYGEWAYNTEKAILAQGGTVMNSRILGSISLFLLDPIENIGNGINSVFGKELVQTSSIFLTVGRAPLGSGSADRSGDYLGFQMHIRF
jgi:hypothetical protein